MEQKSPELKIKSFTNRRTHIIKPFQFPVQRPGNTKEHGNSGIYGIRPSIRRANYPSFKGALKWMRENRSTIDTLVELLQIHPELLRYQVLSKLLNYLHSFKIQTHSSDNPAFDVDKKQKGQAMESIPTITVTTDAFNKTADITKTRLLVVGKQMFEEENGICSDLISGLTEHFVMYCHMNDDPLDFSNVVKNSDVCLFLVSESSLADNQILTLLQQVKLAEIPLLFVKANNFNMPQHIKQQRSASSCSAQETDSISPILLPLPPISRTPNYITVVSHFVPHYQSAYILEGCKSAIEYSPENAKRCTRQICTHFNIKTADQHDPHPNDDLDVEMDLLSMSDTPIPVDNVTDGRANSVCGMSYAHDTLGASLVVMEHMTNCTKERNEVFVETEQDQRPQNTKNKLGIPSLSACKTPPLSPIFKKRNNSNISQNQKSGTMSYTNLSTQETNEDRINSRISDSSTTENTTFLLFPNDKGRVSTKIINWPQDAKNLPCDDYLSEGSSSTGFQDIDFTASLWSTNSDDEYQE